VDVSENILSGIPVTVGYSGSPNKYLTATRVNALVPTDQAKTPGWTMGQWFPTAAQAPYFDMNAFGYAASYTIGSLGARTLQAPGLFVDAVLRDQELEVQGTSEVERPAGRAQSAMEETEPFGARHHVHPQQPWRVRPFHRHGGRLLKLWHRPSQRAGKRSRGVLIRAMH
jgi:hypothetical protein